MAGCNDFLAANRKASLEQLQCVLKHLCKQYCGTLYGHAPLHTCTLHPFDRRTRCAVQPNTLRGARLWAASCRCAVALPLG